MHSGGPCGWRGRQAQRWAAFKESFFPTLTLGQLRPTPWHVARGSRLASAGERMREASKASSHGSRLSFLHRANLRIPFLLSESREGSVQGWALLPRPLSHIFTQSHRWFQRCPHLSISSLKITVKCPGFTLEGPVLQILPLCRNSPRSGVEGHRAVERSCWPLMAENEKKTTLS